MFKALRKFNPVCVKYNHILHYDTLKTWWEGHKWEPVQPVFLPQIGTVIESNDIPICAGFVYQAKGTPLGWLEWVISDPESERSERDKSLDLLITDLIEKAKEAGTPVLFTSSNHAGLISRYTSHGFKETDTGVTHLIRSGN